MQTAIESNLQKIKEFARKNEGNGYYVDSTLEEYRGFCPPQYASYEEIINEIYIRKRNCRILEIGPGTGRAAKKICKLFPETEYHAVSIDKPEFNGMVWFDIDIDNFVPEYNYDLIFSVNGIHYGYDDKANFFKLINSLNLQGIITFNFQDNCAIKKASKFRKFMEFHFLDTLYDVGIHGFSPRYIIFPRADGLYFGKKTKELPAIGKIEEKVEEFKGQKKTSFVTSLGEPQIWIDLTNKQDYHQKIREALLSAVKEKELKMYGRVCNYTNSFDQRDLESFMDFTINPDRNLNELLLEKIPIDLLIETRWPQHPEERRK